MYVPAIDGSVYVYTRLEYESWNTESDGEEACIEFDERIMISCF